MARSLEMGERKPKGAIGGEPVETSVDRIGAALDKQSLDWREAWKGAAVLSSSRTVLVFAPTVGEFASARDLVQQLSQFNPARFFIVAPGEGEKISCQVSAVCHQLSTEQVILSEVVSLKVPKPLLPAVRNILEANRLENVPTQGVLLQIDSMIPQFYDAAIHLSDQIIIDSSIIKGDFEILSPLLKSGCEMLDLEWARTSLWRGEIRKAFNRPALSELLSTLGSIRIDAGTSQRGGPASGALLLAGWILSCLGLELKFAIHGGFECVNREGGVVAVRINLNSGQNPLRAVQFKAVGSKGSILDLCLNDALLIESSSEIIPSFRASVQNEDLAGFKVLPRIFLVGPSLRHYNSSLRSAIEFEKLRSSFTV